MRSKGARLWKGRPPGLPTSAIERAPRTLTIKLDADTREALQFGLDSWRARGIALTRQSYVRMALRHAAAGLAEQLTSRSGLFDPELDSIKPQPQDPK